jgi:lipopolysaccharide biosynthesis glycosyltransferase
VAAVRDFGWPCGHRELTAAGWNLSDPYFNSGVLLINLKVRGHMRCKWSPPLRAIRSKLPDLPPAQALQARSIVVEKLLAEHGSALIYQDQDVFNLLASMGGGWLELPLEWNVQVRRHGCSGFPSANHV